MWVVAKIFRQQRLLDISRDSDFLFQPLPLAFAFDQAGIVQNTRRVGGQRIQNLPVEL